jgi:enoyl-CoA hydratase/carnithine racemase
VGFGALRLEHLRTELEDGVAWIRLARPPVNALTAAMVDALAEAVREAAADPAVRVAALASDVPGQFSAGLDVRELASADAALMARLDAAFKDGIVAPLRASRRLFCAVIEGNCFGGGLELALACDLRIGSRGAWRAGLPEVRLGGMPGGGGIQLLARLAGSSRAARVALLGETFGPEDAHAWGVLDALVDDGGAARALVARLAGGPTEAYAAIKLALRAASGTPLADALVLERELYRALAATADLGEGLRAFGEKRAPRFEGR